MNKQINEGEILKNFLKGKGFAIGKIADLLQMTRQNLNYHLRKAALDDDFKRLLLDKLKIDFTDVKSWFANEPKDLLAPARLNTPNNIKPDKATGETIRAQKAFGETEDPGLIVVPIEAQAGYSRHTIDPVSFQEFRRLKLPNLPYKGDNYRVFEVSGDSMEPTLKEGYLVIGELVEPGQWDNIANWYIHIVVTIDRIMVKRLYKKNKENFTAISDNEDFYDQFLIPKKEIKELWAVVRKVDWEMPPPKKFDLKT